MRAEKMMMMGDVARSLGSAAATMARNMAVSLTSDRRTYS